MVFINDLEEVLHELFKEPIIGPLKLKMAEIHCLKIVNLPSANHSIQTKFGTQQQIWNSITAILPIWTFSKFTFADAAILKLFWLYLNSRLTDFSEILRGEAVFHKISTMGQILAFNRTYFFVSLMQLSFGERRFRIVSDALVYSLVTTVCNADSWVKLQ